MSTDAKLEEMQIATHNKPYLSMVFQDGSDFAPMVRSEAELKAAVAEISDVARDESFVTAEVCSRAGFPKRCHRHLPSRVSWQDLDAEEDLYRPGLEEDGQIASLLTAVS